MHGPNFGYLSNSGYYGTKQAELEVDNMAQAGVEWVSLMVMLMQETFYSTRIYRDFTWTPSDTDLEEFVASRQRRDPLRMAECLETWSAGRLISQWSALPEYPGGALLLSGEADGKFRSASVRMQAGFRNAERHSIASAGHQLLVEKPQEVARALSAFLSQSE